MDIPPEYEDRVQVAGDGCWNWTGWIVHTRHGTGSLAPYGTLQRDKKQIPAHRYFFELATGIAPGQRVVHHRCRNTLCVNPDHLELLSRAEHNRLHAPEHPLNQANLARETCSHGHPWREETTYWWRGIRHCRTCCTETMRRWREAHGLTGKPKTHCPQGHPYEGDNLRITPKGHRICRECNRIRSRDAQRRIRERQRAQQTT